MRRVLATRDSSGKVLNAIAEKMPWLLGGAADLAPSTKTQLSVEFAGEFQAPGQGGEYRGRNFHFGIREHAMCAIASGMSLSKLRRLCCELFDFHRLLPRRDPAQRDDGDSGHLHLDPRFDQYGRGRANPSAHRATCFFPRDAGHDRVAPGGRERGG